MLLETYIPEKLLEIEAIKLNVENPFTWASGWKSPIYCDNRKALSFPTLRKAIVRGLADLLKKEFSETTCIAGVATAGIPWGALLANELELPFCYVRPKPKEHGLGNQIEGLLKEDEKVLVMEDLISTGKSSLQVVEVLNLKNIKVVGMLSIFSYGFEEAKLAFEKNNVKLLSLSNYDILLQVALAKNLINHDMLQSLNEWSKNPSQWKQKL